MPFQPSHMLPDRRVIRSICKISRPMIRDKKSPNSGREVAVRMRYFARGDSSRRYFSIAFVLGGAPRQDSYILARSSVLPRDRTIRRKRSPLARVNLKANARSSVLRPWRHYPSHACVRNQLPHMFVSMNNDAEIHAINLRISVRNSDLTLKVFRVLS